MVFQLKATS